ncbi:uncharacterized protein LOC132551160 [Ylistrum balloti]|uniref:uncharacterized protein LOC132551160 n=1 Tax=Ylistrum balloti TaxID=509963 RepID=UPI002905AB36|nr:uncharacterized protein LOC132551160 [Ylistrum balloti]
MYEPSVPVPRVNIDNMEELKDGITFVTAYFDIGSMKRGFIGNRYQGIQTYKNWINAYSQFNNSVIFFTDSIEMETLFRDLRKRFPLYMTRIIKIDKNKLWSFKLAPHIKTIFAEPWYPKFPPNTINENYSCAMHAKYDLLEIVINERQYKTKHLAWIDAGYFRDKETKLFSLETPPDLKKDHIAFVEINEFQESLTPEDIIHTNKVWIAGGMFLSQPDYLLTFISDYKSAVNSLITKRLMSTDQQVLYIMYSNYKDILVRVPIQTYYHKCKCDWFFLGNLCRFIWERKQWRRPSLAYFDAMTL